MKITLEVPDQVHLAETPAEVGARLKLNAALSLFRSGEISGGAAAELAGVDRFTFMAECGKHGIPTIDYPAEDLHAEVAAFRERP